MSRPVSRREMLRSLACASAATVLPGGASAKASGISVDGKPIELVVKQISPETVRLSFVPLENSKPIAIPSLGSLAQTDWPGPVTRFRELPKQQVFGNIVVKATDNPVTVTVETRDGRM